MPLSISDVELLERLLEEFCEKSDCCKECPYKHKTEDRTFCYFGIKCLLERLNIC